MSTACLSFSIHRATRTACCQARNAPDMELRLANSVAYRSAGVKA